MALFRTLKDDEYLESKNNNTIRTYKIRIITPQGTITEIIKSTELNVSTSGRYYYFRTEDGKKTYYPVNNTIINEV